MNYVKSCRCPVGPTANYMLIQVLTHAHNCSTCRNQNISFCFVFSEVWLTRGSTLISAGPLTSISQVPYVSSKWKCSRYGVQVSLWEEPHSNRTNPQLQYWIVFHSSGSSSSCTICLYENDVWNTLGKWKMWQKAVKVGLLLLYCRSEPAVVEPASRYGSLPSLLSNSVVAVIFLG